MARIPSGLLKLIRESDQLLCIVNITSEQDNISDVKWCFDECLDIFTGCQAIKADDEELFRSTLFVHTI